MGESPCPARYPGISPKEFINDESAAPVQQHCSMYQHGWVGLATVVNIHQRDFLARDIQYATVIWHLTGMGGDQSRPGGRRQRGFEGRRQQPHGYRAIRNVEPIWAVLTGKRDPHVSSLFLFVPKTEYSRTVHRLDFCCLRSCRLLFSALSVMIVVFRRTLKTEDRSAVLAIALSKNPQDRGIISLTPSFAEYLSFALVTCQA